MGAVDLLGGGRKDLHGSARAEFAAGVFVDFHIRGDGRREGGEVGAHRGSRAAALKTREAKQVRAVAHPRGAGRLDFLGDGHGGVGAALHEVGRLPVHLAERVGRAIACPHTPLRCAGGGEHGGVCELDLCGIRIPAPDFLHRGMGAEQSGGCGVGGGAVEVDRVPPGLERVVGALPLRVGGGGEEKGGCGGEEAFHRTVSR